MPSTTPPHLNIAIIGGGPGGLSSAITLFALPNTTVTLYEQARELREIGAGINIGFNCWKVLELLGAAENVRGHVTETVLQRNGITGEILKESSFVAEEKKYRAQRVRRTRLQAALIGKVPEGIIRLRKRLVQLTDLESVGVKLGFEDGEEVVADLVVGGDGIRSIVRQSVFPDHAIKFTGRTIWRTIIPRTLVSSIPEFNTNDVSWWHGPAGHFYNSLVDDASETPEHEQMFEIAVHNVVPPATIKEKRFSWGIPATNERVESHFTEFDPRVRSALEKVPEGEWREFSAFTGPRLEELTAWGKVVLIGDASHPLTGAFGSGAAFAMQDGWILARAVEYARSRKKPLVEALAVFDSIRSPYYLRMYEHLDRQAKNFQEAKEKGQSFEGGLDARVKGLSAADLSWIYQNDIEMVWEEFLENEGSINGHG